MDLLITVHETQAKSIAKRLGAAVRRSGGSSDPYESPEVAAVLAGAGAALEASLREAFTAGWWAASE